jgi:adenylate kinase family enzyme
MLGNVNRISIIGGSGTGKTTLSNNLGEILKLPIYHIDGINYLENWKVRDKDERDKIILEKTNTDKWIIDGTYRSTLKQRLNNSDLIIYLDYSSLAQIRGILERYIKNKGKEKSEIPGCKEKISLQFFFFVLHWRKNKRNEIIENLNVIDKNKILIFKNRRQLNKWYYNEFNKKIL